MKLDVIDAMTAEQCCALDRHIAKLRGWRVDDGVDYAPDGTTFTAPVKPYSTVFEHAVSLLDSTAIRWGMRGQDGSRYECWIGGCNGVVAKTPALAACCAWLQYIERQRIKR